MTINGGTLLHPNVPAITYNGFTFAGPTLRISFELTPRVAVDERTTSANTYVATVLYILTDDPNSLGSFVGVNAAAAVQDSRSRLQQLRARLSKPGQRLQISGMGFDIDINDGSSGAIFDTNWGPKTLRLSIDPVASGVLWQIRWVFEFTIPECVNTIGNGHTDFGSPSYINFPYNAQGLLESLTFNVGYSIDRTGLTVRTTSGELTIAINRASTTGGANNAITNTADEFRSIINPSVPLGFERSSQRWDLSNDKKSLRFGIVDKEKPDRFARPPGVVDIQLDHTVGVAAAILPAPVNINCGFSGSITVHKGYPLSTAFNKLILIMQERLDYAKTKFLADNPAADPDSVPVYITSTRIRESIYGPPRLDIDVSYIIITESANAVFTDLVGRTGLFRTVNVDGVTEEAWQESMAPVWDQRGLSQLEFDAASDAIVGPCEGAGGTLTDQYAQPIPAYLGGGSLVTGCPPSDMSYLFYQSELLTDAKQPTIIHIPLAAPEATRAIDGLFSDDDAPIAPNIQKLNSAERPKAQMTKSMTPLKFCLTGQAFRLGAFPEIPSINVEKFHENYDEGGSSLGRLVPIGTDQIKSTRWGRLGTCAIYHTSWKICYTLTTVDEQELKTIIEALNDAVILTDADPEGAKAGGK